VETPYPPGTRVCFIRHGRPVVGVIRETIGDARLVAYRLHGLDLLTVERTDALTRESAPEP
jgi:hypothetical protein